MSVSASTATTPASASPGTRTAASSAINGEQSHFTFLVYLNDGFEGGATAFHESRASLLVTPEAGKALVFYHRQLHEGMPVVRGRKYFLRTDVMYRYEAR
jgi:hypothetical protein